MTIILMILKIIGIVLLVILGLLLVIVLSLLFVPVRYRVKGRIEEEISGEVRVSWLMHIISFRLNYQDNDVKSVVKIFGFPLKKKENADTLIKVKKTRKPKKVKKKKTAPEAGYKEFVEPVPKAEHKEFAEPVPKAEHKEPAPRYTKASEPKEKKNLFFSKIKAFPGMIRSKVETIKEKVRNISGIISRVKQELSDERNRGAIRLMWQELKLLFKHFWPRRIHVDGSFALSDPAATGQALGIISTLPFVYQHKIYLYPDFMAEQMYFKGFFDIKGVVRGIHALILVIHLIRDKNIRRIIKRYRSMQEVSYAGE